MGVKLKTSNALLNLLTRASLCICLVQSVAHFPGGYASPKGGESQATNPIYLQFLKPSVLEGDIEACFVNASQKPSRSRLSTFWYLGMQPLDKAMRQVVPMEEITLRPEKERQEKRFEQAWNDWQSSDPCSPLPTVTLSVHSQSVRFAFDPNLSQEIRHQIENKSTVVWLDAIQVPIDTETLISILENSLKKIVNWPANCSDQSEPFITEQGEISDPEQDSISRFDQAVDGTQNPLAVLQQKFLQTINRGSRNLALLLRDRVMLINLKFADGNNFSDLLAEQPVGEVPGIIQTPRTGSGTSSRTHGSETTHHKDKAFRTDKENSRQHAGRKRGQWPSESSGHTFDLHCPRCHFKKCKERKPAPPKRMPSRRTESPRDNKHLRLAAPSQQKNCASLKQSHSSYQPAQDELEDGEIMDSELNPEERVALIRQIVKAIKSGETHPDEDKAEGWLCELQSQKLCRTEDLWLQLITALTRRTIKQIEAKDTHPDECHLDHWLEIIQQRNQALAEELSLELLAVRKRLVTKVLEKMEQTLEAPSDEARMMGLLYALRKYNEQEADKLSLRLKVVQVRQVVEHIGKKQEEHPDEKDTQSWIAQIRKEDPNVCSELQFLLNVARVKRVIERKKTDTETLEDVDSLKGWLIAIRNENPAEANKLSLRLHTVQVKQVLKHIEKTHKEHPEEKRLNFWMTHIRRLDPKGCGELQFLLNVARVKRAIERKRTASAPPEGEEDLNGWLIAIRYKDPDEADQLNSSLAEVQIEPALEQMEAGTQYPNEGKVERWLDEIERVNRKKAYQLKGRWFAALEKSVKSVIQAVNDKREHSAEGRMDRLLEALHRLDPMFASNYSAQWCETQVSRATRELENGRIPPNEDKVGGWLDELKNQNQPLAQQLTMQWHIAKVKQAIKIRVVSTQSEDDKVTHYLEQIQGQNQSIANQLSEQYCVNQLKLVIQELETTSSTSTEEKVSNWLNKLNTLKSTHYENFARYYLAIIRTKQVIQAMEAGNHSPGEKTISHWLRTISYRNEVVSRLLYLHYRIALGVRALKVPGEVGITPQEETELQNSLLKYQGQDKARPVLACWASFQAEKVILKIEAAREHQNEDRMTEFLKSIRLQDEVKADEYFARWVAARISRMIWGLENERKSCDRTEIEGLLAELQKHKAEQTDHLRKRWHAALASANTP